MMTEKLWFKQWASSYLTDPRVDRLTDAAAVLLQRMRCVCCLEGSCPTRTSEIARRTMRSESQVIESLPSVLQFFVYREDRLFDVGQERDNAVTERSRKGANAANAKRKASATSDAAGDAAGDALSDAASEAHAKVESWLEGLGRFPVSVATSDARAVAAADAKKLEVRSIERKVLEAPPALSQISDVRGSEVRAETQPVQNVENVPRGTLEPKNPKPSFEVDDSKWRDRLAIPDGHGRYKPRSTSNTNPNTGSERREAV
jgi:hypothetical protein